MPPPNLCRDFPLSGSAACLAVCHAAKLLHGKYCRVGPHATWGSLRLLHFENMMWEGLQKPTRMEEEEGSKKRGGLAEDYSETEPFPGRSQGMSKGDGRLQTAGLAQMAVAQGVPLQQYAQQQVCALELT